MKHMSLFGNGKKQEDEYGTDLPGTVSLYLVELDKGVFYLKEDNAGIPVCSSDWDKAAHFFALAGLLEAQEIAKKHHGHVSIVSCTPVKPYREPTL